MIPKKIRLEDVAKLAGVSRASAGKVLNGASDSIRVSEPTRAKILAAARKLDYQQNIAASILAGGSSGLIGVLIDSHAQYRANAILRELEVIAKKRGMRILISSTHDDLEDMKKNLQTMHRYGTDAIICLSHRYPGMRDHFIRLFGNETNIAFCGKPELDKASYVTFSRLEAFKTLIANLKKRGIRRFFTVMADPFFASESDLYREFSEALVWNGLEFCPKTMTYVITQGTTPQDQMRKLADRLCSMSNPPEFIFLDDASHASCLQNQLIARGWRLPDNLIFYGGNGEPAFHYTVPPIPSLEPHYDKIAEALLGLALNPPPSPVQIVIGSEIIQRI